MKGPNKNVGGKILRVNLSFLGGTLNLMPLK